MLARDTYDPGKEGLTEPIAMRNYNELIHRVSTFQKQVIEGDASGIPVNVFFDFLARETTRLNLSPDTLEKMLS
jgi:hypothetical protein